jgi:hypothetical protein
MLGFMNNTFCATKATWRVCELRDGFIFLDEHYVHSITWEISSRVNYFT